MHRGVHFSQCHQIVTSNIYRDHTSNRLDHAEGDVRYTVDRIDHTGAVFVVVAKFTLVGGYKIIQFHIERHARFLSPLLEQEFLATCSSEKTRINLDFPLKMVEERRTGENTEDEVHQSIIQVGDHCMNEVHCRSHIFEQAAIIRIMKAKQSMKHAVLVREVIEELTARCKPHVPAIQVRTWLVKRRRRTEASTHFSAMYRDVDRKEVSRTGSWRYRHPAVFSLGLYGFHILMALLFQLREM